MKDFHSTLLKPMPGTARPNRRRIPGRILLISILGLLVVAPWLIIATRLLPPDGTGYVFYWVHDHIYLPVKGYAFTLFYPYSISWWGMAATVFIAWLAGYLLMVSFIKNPHVSLLRGVVRRDAGHRFLIKTAGWLKRRRLEPVMLREVTDLERTHALNRLVSAPLWGDKKVESMVRRLVRLTEMHITLITSPPAGQDAYFQAVLVWHQTFLQVFARSRGEPGAGDIGSSLLQLSRLLKQLVLPLFDHNEPGRLKEAMEQPAGFDISSTAVDLLTLGALYDTGLAEELWGIPGSAAESGEVTTRAAAQRLAASVAQRQTIINGVRALLEKPNPRPELLESYLPLVEEEDEKAEEKRKSILSASSALSLSTALSLAVLMDNVSLGLAYMESQETLEFVLNGLMSGDPRIDVTEPLVQPPEPGHYRLCARMAEKEIDLLEANWQQPLTDPDSPIKKQDIELARSRVRILDNSAGPADLF